MSTVTSPRLKTPAIGLGIGVTILLLVRFALKVPTGNIILALFPALATGLTAVALVLMYRTARIVNWAQIAMGAISAVLFFQLYSRSILPYGAALAVAILAGIILALIMGTISALLFFKHPRLVLTVVTIVFIGLIGFVTGQINSLFVQPGEIQQPVSIVGPYPNTSWEIDQIPFRIAHLVGLLLMGLLAVGLVIFFRKTRVGTAVRASAENSDRASLLGINVRALQVGVWAIVGLIASIGTLAVMPVEQFNSAAAFNQAALLLPLTAAVVARMNSMPVAFFTAAGIVVLERGISFATDQAALVQIGIFVVLMAMLLLQRRKLNARQEEASSWKAVKEVRAIPRELMALPAVSRTRRVLLLLLGLAVLGLPWITGIQTINGLANIWMYGIVGISLVILTGWSGQISLGQFAIVTVGAFIAGKLLLAGVPFLIVVPLAGLAGAAFSLLIGLPALRIRGLFLAVTTFAVAVVLPLLVFDPKFLGDFVPSEGVPRPKFLFLDFNDERSMYYLLFLFFVATVFALQALRQSRAGRVLIAIRDNEDGVRSFGVDVVRTRLIAFALSGFIAGLAGSLFVSQQLGMSSGFYNFGQSITVFILVVIGGVSSAVGAVLGAVWFIGGGLLFPGIIQILQGFGGLAILMFIPGGLAQVLFGMRDGILRVIAMRQHIVVPSLFADYSPEAWEKRLAPLSQPMQSHGLAALRHDQRYRLTSRIFGRANA